ncbi:MAG: DUF2341 domain-containing protein, partial [Actinobacteria bacterium]|nr:DUF2341 domain-containing protein [Actinomycetota bacterium]
MIITNVDLSDFGSQFFNNVRSDGGDIRITTGDGTTELARELVSIDTASSTGELHFKANEIDAEADTDFYIYYGNTAAVDYALSDTYGSQNVWSDGYAGVWHLSEGSGDARDSTANNSNGTNNGATQGATGQVGDGYEFDGTDDYVKITENFVSSPSELTISAWFKNETGGDNFEAVLHKGSANTVGSSDYWIGVSSGDNLTATIGANAGPGWDAGETNTLANIGQWYYMTASWDGSVVDVYLDGQFDKQYSLSSYGNLDTDTRFGASADGTNYEFGGTASEIRIYNKSISGNEIETTYNNQNSPSTFYTISGSASEAPVLLTPEDAATGVARNPTLDWEPVQDAAEYQVQVSPTSTFSSITVDADVTDSDITLGSPYPSLNASTTYHWRVRTVDGQSFGGWSTDFEFTTAAGLAGSGTEADPYLVSTPQDLDDVRNDMDAYYRLTQDIDLTFDTQDPNGDFYNAGSGWAPIGTFSGEIDLGGHSIIGLYVSRTSSVGFFDIVD